MSSLEPVILHCLAETARAVRERRAKRMMCIVFEGILKKGVAYGQA